MISRKRLSAIALFGVAAIAFVYYAPSLRFGFFNDDPTGHFRWMEGRSIGSLLTDAAGHSYYRPFSFVLWQMLHSILGRHAPIVLHLLNVLAHAANAALVTQLANKLTNRLTYATLAGLLFALYPFSYEAVPYVGSFVHPLATLLILLTLALYLRWQEDKASWAFATAHIALMCAVLTQENAVITPVLLMGLGFVRKRTYSDIASRNGAESAKPAQAGSPFATDRRFTLGQLSFFAEPLLFTILWLIVPKTLEARTISLDAIRANILPFVQALVYPAAPLAAHNARTLAILALLALILLIVLAWLARLLRLIAFGLLLWLLASLPSILILDQAYVLGSPRLFYLASVGAALVWALPALALDRLLGFESLASPGTARQGKCARSQRLLTGKLGVRYPRWVTWILIFAICYLPSASYVHCQLAYQGLAGQVGQMMAEATRSTSAGQPVTFVNLPYFFSSRGPGTECASPFVFAPTGAVVIPPYADARDFAYYNGGLDRPTLAITLPEYQPGWQTFGAPVSVKQLRDRLGISRVFVFDLLQWRLLDLSTMWQPASQTEQVKYKVGGLDISNVGFQISKEELETKLTWQVSQTVKDVKVFAHVYDIAGKLVAQDDGLPVDGFAPAMWWQVDDVITDTRSIRLAGLSAGTYRVTVGMYEAATGRRFEARDALGVRQTDDELLIGQVTR